MPSFTSFRAIFRRGFCGSCLFGIPGCNTKRTAFTLDYVLTTTAGFLLNSSWSSHKIPADLHISTNISTWNSQLFSVYNSFAGGSDRYMILRYIFPYHMLLFAYYFHTLHTIFIRIDAALQTVATDNYIHKHDVICGRGSHCAICTCTSIYTMVLVRRHVYWKCQKEKKNSLSSVILTCKTCVLHLPLLSIKVSKNYIIHIKLTLYYQQMTQL